MNSYLCLIIVTHNSELFISRCIDSIDSQTVSVDRVIIVDSGSDDPSYLEQFQNRPDVTIYLKDNIGFGAGNNYGLRYIDGSAHYVLFLNPDIILGPDAVERSIESLRRYQSAAIVSGRLKGYDFVANSATGLLDSTGSFRTWFGRWYDRGQGSADDQSFNEVEVVPALCGAFMFCRLEALAEERPEVFDESFFMYKEDIDLCLRLSKKGWKMIYQPAVVAFHGRGWSQDRREVDYQMRCMASRNEVFLNLKHRSPYIFWAVLKYLLVRLLHV